MFGRRTIQYYPTCIICYPFYSIMVKRLIKDEIVLLPRPVEYAIKEFAKNHLFFIPEDCPQAVIKIVNDSNKCLSENASRYIKDNNQKKAITAIENIMMPLCKMGNF